jgi:hypothetical protein
VWHHCPAKNNFLSLAIINCQKFLQ